MKIRYIIWGIIIGCISLGCVIVCYNYYSFAEGIKKDTNRIFKYNKNLFQALSFSGVIMDKNDFGKKSKFIIRVKVNKLEGGVSNTGFPPYYYYEGDTILLLSVGSKVFKNLKEGDNIYKSSESRFVINERESYEILSGDSLSWLP